MGGARSEVQADTTRVLLEVATWSGPNIHRTSWALGLRSEASSRFEKGLAPEQCMHAQAVATQLMIELCGATVAPGTIDVGGSGPPPPDDPAARARACEAILGVPVARERQAEILQGARLRDEADARPTDGALRASTGAGAAPRRRHARGRPDRGGRAHRRPGAAARDAARAARRLRAALTTPSACAARAEDALVGRGLHEIVGWTSPTRAARPAAPARRDPRAPGVVRSRTRSPRSSRMLRPTLLGSLLDAAPHNASRNGAGDLRLFESGTVYRAARRTAPCADGHHAPRRAARAARSRPASWRGARSAARGRLLRRQGAARSARSPRCACDSRARPDASRSCTRAQRRGAARRARRSAGWASCTRSSPRRGTRRTACWRSTSTSSSRRRRAPGYRSDLIGYPPLRQDLAVVLPDEVSAAQVLAAVREAGGELLDDVRVFDVYSGAQVGEGRRSLALALAFRAAERTLTDEDVAPVRERIVAALESWEVSCVADASASRRERAARARRRRHRLRRRARRAPAVAPSALRARRPSPGARSRAAPGRALPALPRAAGDRAARPRRARADRRGRSSPTRTRPPRPPSARCASAARAWST